MSVVMPQEYLGDSVARKLARGAFARGADAELERCIELIRQYEERGLCEALEINVSTGKWTADRLIARLREGRD